MIPDAIRASSSGWGAKIINVLAYRADVRIMMCNKTASAIVCVSFRTLNICDAPSFSPAQGITRIPLTHACMAHARTARSIGKWVDYQGREQLKRSGAMMHELRRGS